MTIHADSYHILRDTRAAYLHGLTGALRRGTRLSNAALQAIEEGAGGYFDAVVSTDRRNRFAEVADGLTSSRISLVSEDDLALSIRLDNMTARLFENTGGALWKLHLRFVTLLRRPDLPKTDNPVGPRGIGEGILTMFTAAGASTLDQKLDLLDLIEDRLDEGLPALYADLNALLEKNGVEAAQPAIVGTPGKAAVGAPAARSDEILRNLQDNLAARQPDTAAPASNQEGAPASLISQAALDKLMARLEELERLAPAATRLAPVAGELSISSLFPGLFGDAAEPTAAAPATEVRASAPRIIHSEELGLPKAAHESLSIDTLALIFEAILDDPELPGMVKTAISSLQVKLLKLAMKDASLFSDLTHPARLVIDRMGQAAIGLPDDAPASHPVCANLFAIAARLRGRSGLERSVFEGALGELDALEAARVTALREAAAPYLPVLQKLDQRDRIAGGIRIAIERALDTDPPEAICRFIDRTWRKVLLRIGQESGTESQAWTEHLAALDGLLWSIRPKNGAEERQMLAQRLPGILKTIKGGMERIGTPPAEQNAFFDTCFALQQQALRVPSQAPAKDEATGARRLKSGEMQPLMRTLHIGDKALALIDFAADIPASAEASGYLPGVWLTFTGGDGRSQLACVAATSPAGRRVLLLDPANEQVIAMHVAVLDRQTREGKATLKTADSLFERAAQEALSRTA